MGNNLVPGQVPRSHEHVQILRNLNNIRILGDTTQSSSSNASINNNINTGGYGSGGGNGLTLNKHFKQGRVVKTGT